jgi:hypothetical protein
MAPFAIVLVTLLAISNINISKDYKTGSMEVDGRGYYAYLPAIFIYHDLSYKFFYEIERQTYYNPTYYFSYLRLANGKVINKYFAGTSLCMLPFFILGHLSTLAAGLPADGYSYYYMLWIHLGALMYLLAGLLAVRRLLLSYGISEKWIAASLLVIVFGTNLFYYVLTEYSMSHVYSFAMISMFLLSCRKYFTLKSGKSLLIAGLTLGIIALIRPVNLVILLSLPFIAGDLKSFKSGIMNLWQQKYYFGTAIFLFLLIVSIQPVIYKLQTGSFLVYSYPGEGFRFSEFHMIDMLFSYKKGLFIYTPVLFISLLGYRYLWQQNIRSAIFLVGFMVILTYLLSSWHMWYYGGSFSQRVFIDFYALFTIPLALALENIRETALRKGFITSLLVLTLFCQFQTYQYRHMVIHWSDMSKERYWDNFFKLNP